MRSLLWVGDGCVSTGFARASHYTCDYLDYRTNPSNPNPWQVSMLAINYDGDPHAHPYDIYPARGRGMDLFGVKRLPEVIAKVHPDVVVVQNDPWNLPAYMQAAGNVPVVASVAVDGRNCAGQGFNGLAMAIFWTAFGEQEARLGGYTGASAVVPLGVDLDIYKSGSREDARKALRLPGYCRDAFIVGNVNRNQPRKRLDLAVMYFAEWIKTHHVDDAYFFFHVAPTGEQGYNVKQLAHYYGIARHLILSEPDVGQGYPEEDLCTIYRSFDAMLTTTQGEGFGLTTFEGMACGIPQIVPDWSALGELCEGAALLVPCTTLACTPNLINVIGGVADRVKTIEALDAVYRDTELRADLSGRGRVLVAQDCYRWPNIGRAFGDAVEQALYPEKLNA